MPGSSKMLTKGGSYADIPMQSTWQGRDARSMQMDFARCVDEAGTSLLLHEYHLPTSRRDIAEALARNRPDANIEPGGAAGGCRPGTKFIPTPEGQRSSAAAVQCEHGTTSWPRTGTWCYPSLVGATCAGAPAHPS
eukprot:1042986-Amphidinium_carterae.1